MAAGRLAALTAPPAGRLRGVVRRRAGLLGLAALLGAACVQEDGRRLDPVRAAVSVSEDDELSVGIRADAQIQDQVSLIDDPVVLGLVHDLGQRIVATTQPQPFLYRFRVLVDPNLNAFALPGGFIYFHSATLLQAGSLDELAGVMSHEIAHVKARHYKRGREQALIPDLLAGLGGLAAAVTTGESGFLMIAQGVNVALQLRYSREFENEADELGSVFMTRVGYDPKGMGVFFERILAADRPSAITIPPYLYSHPALKERIDGVKARAGKMQVIGGPDPALEGRFAEACTRLSLLVESGRSTWQPSLPAPDRTRSAPRVDAASTRLSRGDWAGALVELERAEATDPNDPGLPFRRGELLEERGQRREAILAWRRSVALDPGTALTHFRLGRAYRALGEPAEALFWYEQAQRRFAPGGVQALRAAFAIDTLVHPPVVAAGLAGDEAEARDATPEESRREFSGRDERAIWWARIDPRHAPVRREIEVRWIDPAGVVVQEERIVEGGKDRVWSELALGAEPARRAGGWRLEALLRGEQVDARSFRLSPR
jgi:predicted Zn-dependent protease